jgi:hypothetical protein
MSSLAEIEAAVESLSPQQQRELLKWLEIYVPKATPAVSPGADVLNAFRELQRETAMIPAAAKAWKAAVSDARRCF